MWSNTDHLCDVQSSAWSWIDATCSLEYSTTLATSLVRHVRKGRRRKQISSNNWIIIKSLPGFALFFGPYNNFLRSKHSFARVLVLVSNKSKRAQTNRNDASTAKMLSALYELRKGLVSSSMLVKPDGRWKCTLNTDARPVLVKACYRRSGPRSLPHCLNIGRQRWQKPNMFTISRDQNVPQMIDLY